MVLRLLVKDAAEEIVASPRFSIQIRQRDGFGAAPDQIRRGRLYRMPVSQHARRDHQVIDIAIVLCLPSHPTHISTHNSKSLKGTFGLLVRSPAEPRIGSA